MFLSAASASLDVAASYHMLCISVDTHTHTQTHAHRHTNTHACTHTRTHAQCWILIPTSPVILCLIFFWQWFYIMLLWCTPLFSVANCGKDLTSVSLWLICVLYLCTATERRTATVGRLLVVIAEGVNLSTGEDGRFTCILCRDFVNFFQINMHVFMFRHFSVHIVALVVNICVHCEPKNTSLSFITLTHVDQFWKFFHIRIGKKFVTKLW